MAVQPAVMRKIKKCLCLKFEADLPHEKIARALQLSRGVDSKYIKAARDTGIEWPVLARLDEVALGAALVPATQIIHTRGDRVLPDIITLHRELRCKGVTLQLLWEGRPPRPADLPLSSQQWHEPFALSASGG